jgi:aryl-alcohol dehydrogenase-like predicted oxidoreductase
VIDRYAPKNHAAAGVEVIAMIFHPQADHVAKILSKPTGPLGLGCGQLLSAGDRKSALRLLETAFDNGIIYFDTARLYAEGLAEGMLGDAFARRRDKVILVSKAGILPTTRSLSKRISDKAVTILRKAPPLQSVLKAPKAAEPVFDVFDVPRLRASVERSLKELRTDYLDALLLHECTSGTAADPEIKDFAEDLVKQGKIRAYGVAPRAEDALEMQRKGIAFGAILQFANNVWEDNISYIPPRSDRLLVTHSVLGFRFKYVVDKLSMDKAAAERWRAQLDVEPSDVDSVAGLFLRQAIQANASGIVLFSTTNPERIRKNLRALEKPMSADEARMLKELAHVL